MNGSLPSRPIVVSAGEPAGIGPELCLALAGSSVVEGLVFVADPEQLEIRARRIGADCGALPVLPIDLPNKTVCGEPDPVNAEALLGGLERAVAGCIDGEFAALVTAPLQKSAIVEAGIPFSGHTEYIAGLTSTETPVMLLVAGDLRVALATTHLPLRDVADFLTADRLRAVIGVLAGDLQRRFGIAEPAIAVCGLNPHAGENGHLGTEDRDVIGPVIDELRRDGIDVRGPLPADTAFTPGGGSADAVLAMYHDQGLPVLKYAGFGRAVNVTLGLPIVRTSVDHGTALDIAGSGTADTGSMHAAVALAADLASR